MLIYSLYIILIWDEGKEYCYSNILYTLVEDLTAFCPTRFKEYTV